MSCSCAFFVCPELLEFIISSKVRHFLCRGSFLLYTCSCTTLPYTIFFLHISIVVRRDFRLRHQWEHVFADQHFPYMFICNFAIYQVLLACLQHDEKGKQVAMSKRAWGTTVHFRNHRTTRCYRLARLRLHDYAVKWLGLWECDTVSRKRAGRLSSQTTEVREARLQWVQLNQQHQLECETTD